MRVLLAKTVTCGEFLKVRPSAVLIVTRAVVSWRLPRCRQTIPGHQINAKAAIRRPALVLLPSLITTKSRAVASVAMTTGPRKANQRSTSNRQIPATIAIKQEASRQFHGSTIRRFLAAAPAATTAQSPKANRRPISRRRPPATIAIPQRVLPTPGSTTVPSPAIV